MNNKATPTTFEKVVMILLVTTPVLNIYGTPTSMSVSQLITLVLSVFYFGLFVLRGGGERVFWKGLSVYFLYRGVSSILYGSSIINVIEQFLGFFLAFGCFQRDYYIRIMKAFGTIAIVFFFIQFFGRLAAGVQISGILSFLPMHDDIDVIDFLYNKTHSVRSSAFFSEPSHMAQFLLPLLAIELFYDNKRRHFLYAGVIFIVILLLQSGTGFMGLIPIAVFLIIYLLKDDKRKSNKKLAIVAVIIAAAGAFYMFINSEMGAGVLERSTELSSEYEGGSRSGFLRLWRGYYVFEDYSFREQLFGVTNQNVILEHVYHSGMSFGIRAELYFNGFQDILLYTGYVGLIIFVIVLRYLWKGNTLCGKAIIGTFVALMLVENIYFSNVMLVHLLLSESMKEKYSQYSFRQ